MAPKLLELCCGTRSISRAFQARGWRTTTVDIDPLASPDWCRDVRDITPGVGDFADWQPGAYAAVWASPPCQHYSIARSNAKTPRDLETADAVAQACLRIITALQPAAFFVENPGTGMLHKRPFMAPLNPPREVTYCSYLKPPTYRKLTHIWTNLGPEWEPRPICKKTKTADHRCSPCRRLGRHPASAQKGPSYPNHRTLDQYSTRELHSIPRELCEQIAEAAERRAWARRALNNLRREAP